MEIFFFMIQVRQDKKKSKEILKDEINEKSQFNKMFFFLKAFSPLNAGCNKSTR